MNHLRRSFLHNTHAKTNYGIVLVLVVIVAFVVIGMDRGWFGNISLPFSVQGNSNSAGNGVDRHLEFSFTDKYSGSALTSKTFYVYSGDNPPVLLETLTTDGSGLAHTAQKYTSGTVLNINYVSTNSKEWYSVTVPSMSAADAQSQQYNSIDCKAFTIGTYSQTIMVSSVNAASNYTVKTMAGNVAPIFVYQVTNTGADNTGMIESQVADPIYGDQWGVWLVVKISGAGYETIIPQGFDQTFQLGQATYGVIHLNADMLTKWKIGNTYASGYTGGETVTFSMDLSGYTVNTASAVVTAYAYCDPTYALTHGGNFGNAKFQLSTSTIALDGTS